jgi:hypothetical protein
MSGIPYAVAKALPAQQYPGEIFEFIDATARSRSGGITTRAPCQKSASSFNWGASARVTNLMTRALIITAALAIGITLGAASQISPSVRNVVAATGLAGREIPQVSQDPAAPAPALRAPDRRGDEDQERARGM